MTTRDYMKLYDQRDSDKAEINLRACFMIPSVTIKIWVQHRINSSANNKSAEHIFFPIVY